MAGELVPGRSAGREGFADPPVSGNRPYCDLRRSTSRSDVDSAGQPGAIVRCGAFNGCENGRSGASNVNGSPSVRHLFTSRRSLGRPRNPRQPGLKPSGPRIITSASSQAADSRSASRPSAASCDAGAESGFFRPGHAADALTCAKRATTIANDRAGVPSSKAFQSGSLPSGMSRSGTRPPRRSPP